MVVAGEEAVVVVGDQDILVGRACQGVDMDTKLVRGREAQMDILNPVNRIWQGTVHLPCRTAAAAAEAGTVEDIQAAVDCHQDPREWLLIPRYLHHQSLVDMEGDMAGIRMLRLRPRLLMVADMPHQRRMVSRLSSRRILMLSRHIPAIVPRKSS